MNHKLYTVIFEQSELVQEHRKKNAVVVLNGKEVPFGHADHVSDMQATLAGLERIRDCYEHGSGNRLMYSQACGRLRKLIKDITEKVATSLEHRNSSSK